MKKGLLTLTLIGLLAMVGCANTGSSSSTQSSLDSTVASSSTVSSASSQDGPHELGYKYEDKYYILPDNFTETSFHMSTSGALIEINVDKAFIPGQEDVISFNFNTILSDTSTVTSSNEEVFKVEKVDEFTYKIKAIHEGNAALTIMDGNGLHRFRKTIYVRDALTVDEMEDYLCEVDHWVSYAGYGDNYTLTFLFDQKVAISGSISNSPYDRYTAGYELTKETELEYQYKFTGEEAKNSSSGLTGFNISKVGDFMYLQYSAGTAALMFPDTKVIN